MSTVDDVAPAVPKIEHFEEESFSESSPEPEEQSLTQEPAQVQKRKGGRKPVWRDRPCCPNVHLPIGHLRFMRHRKNASSGIAKLRLLSGNDEQNTSSNSRLQSSSTKRLFRVCNKIIEQQQMSA